LYCLQTKRVGWLLAALGCAASAWGQEAKDEVAVAAPAKVNVSVTKEEARERPPDFKVRMEVLWKNMRGFQAFYETVPGTLFDEARNFPHDWGRGFPGLGKRLANQYGQFVVSEVIESGIAAVHHEDPRYFYSTDKAIKARVRHAIVMTFMNERSDQSGKRVVAISRIAGVYGSWAIAQMWSPDSVQNFHSFILWGSVGMGFKAGGNVAREFLPDIKRMYFNRKNRKAVPVVVPPPAPAVSAPSVEPAPPRESTSWTMWQARPAVENPPVLQ
jgi:hypothetical protein